MDNRQKVIHELGDVWKAIDGWACKAESGIIFTKTKREALDWREFIINNADDPNLKIGLQRTLK